MSIIKNMREILLFISMIFSFLGVYLVGVNKFFIERIKSFYKHYPGKESKLNMFINMIAVIIAVIDVISIFIFLYILIINRENIGEMNSSLDLTLIFLLLPIILIMPNLIFYEQSKFYFIWKLSGNYITIDFFILKLTKKISNMKIFYVNNLVKKVALKLHNSIQKKIINKKNSNYYTFVNKKYKFFKRSAKIYATFFVVYIGKLVLVFYDFNLNKFVNIEDFFNKSENKIIFVVCIAYCIMSIGMVVFDNSLKLIYEEFKKNYTYVLIGKDNKQIINCKAYIEYKDYYLIIEHNVEKYIIKNEVIRIEKMSDNKK